MDAKTKKQYETPASDVVEVRFEGIICGSDGTNGTNGSRSVYGDAVDLDS